MCSPAIACSQRRRAARCPPGRRGRRSASTAPSPRSSDTVTTLGMRNGAGSGAIADYCRDKCGVVLGRGLGAHEGKAFRIAHMGHVNAPMIFGTLSVVEMALAALNVPHGRGGAQAAVEFLAKAVPA